jgi:uncharacterized membrane protein
MSWMTTSRLEAFSDGVFAVVITLLVLDLRTDPADPAHLSEQLARAWPAFAAYLLSFLVVGVAWVNHHALVALAAKTDRTLLFYNLLLLLWLATIPFTTATLAGFLRHDENDSRLALLLYGLSHEGMALAFTAMLAHISRHDLLRYPVSARSRRIGLLRFGIAGLLYPIAVLVGMWSSLAMLLFYAAINAFYVLEQTPIFPGVAPTTSAGGELELQLPISSDSS